MATEQEIAEVQHMIESFYQFAALPLPNNFEVNESVAAIFGAMLNETSRCSRAFAWVPRPTGGRASIAWLAMQLGRGMFDTYRGQLSFACAREVIRVWKTPFHEAVMGLSSRKLPLWA